MIYENNRNPTLLLLHGHLMYHVKDYNIDLKETNLRLSQEDKTNNFQKLKKRQFVNSLIILI